MENFYVSKLVEEIMEGRIVLPDFQRDFVWDSDHVRELVVSVLGNYHIGSMLMLEDFRQEDCPFAIRLIYGVTDINNFVQIKPVVDVILDGQQRATALLYALKQPDIKLKNRKNPYKFYINIQKALDCAWDDAVISVNTANKTELAKIQSSPDNIQLTDFLDPQKLLEKTTRDPRFDQIFRLSDQFRNHHIHVIPLSKDTTLDKIAETFERVNRFTVSLTTFELLTARLRKYGLNLPDLWRETQKKYEFAKPSSDVTKASSNVDPEVVLRVVSLSRGQGVKRGDLLNIDFKDFRDDWATSCRFLNIAYKRLLNHYGVLSFPKWVPYMSMMVPLASILRFMHTEKLDFETNYSKTDRWYWTSVFHNRYDEGASSKQETDFKALKEWINDHDKTPAFINEFNPIRDVTLSVEKQNAATYKGVMNLIVVEGCLDFQTGQRPQLDEDHVQDDHIFPKSIYHENRILNRTLLTTNVIKAKTIPSEYFQKLLQQHGNTKLKKILNSHLIPDDALQYLLANDMHKFMQTRGKAIRKKIKQKVRIVS